MSGGDEDSTSAIESRLHLNKKRLTKVLKIIHSKRKIKKDSPQSNRIIKYYRPYHDSSSEQFYLPKEWKKLTMIGSEQKKEKEIIIIGKN